MCTRAALVLLLLIAGCGGQASAPTKLSTTEVSAPTACGDIVGAWSPGVDGLRARIVTSGSKPDRSGLRIVLEIENVEKAPIEINWKGPLYHGFATYRLDDAAGNDVEPKWSFPGSELAGPARSIFAPRKVVAYVLHDGTFQTMMGSRVLRIGVFWGRELPSDGSRKTFRAKVTGGPATVDVPAYEGSEFVEFAPHVRVWIGSLDVPGVCIQ